MPFAADRARPAHLPAVHRNRADRAAAVLARDGGRCAACALDCVGLRAAAASLRDRLGADGTRAARALLAEFGIRLRPGAALPSRLWQVDHVNPVAEGGDDDLANLATLCLRCHAEKTAAQRPRMQRRPRPAAPVSIERATIGEDGALRFSLPIATPSLNETLRHHRNIGARGKTAATLRWLVQGAIPVEFRTRRRALRIEFARTGRRILDADNAIGGAKALTDSLRYSGTIADDAGVEIVFVGQALGEPRTDVAIWFREDA